MSDELDAEDAKIVTLARSTRARSGAPEGAAVRDTDGRTYAAATVELPSLRLSALQLAVAMAVSSGAQGLEAAAVVSEATVVSPHDLSIIRDVSRRAPILVAGLDGTVTTVVSA